MLSNPIFEYSEDVLHITFSFSGSVFLLIFLMKLRFSWFFIVFLWWTLCFRLFLQNDFFSLSDDRIFKVMRIESIHDSNKSVLQEDLCHFGNWLVLEGCEVILNQQLWGRIGENFNISFIFVFDVLAANLEIILKYLLFFFISIDFAENLSVLLLFVLLLLLQRFFLSKLRGCPFQFIQDL